MWHLEVFSVKFSESHALELRLCKLEIGHDFRNRGSGFGRKHSAIVPTETRRDPKHEFLNISQRMWTNNDFACIKPVIGVYCKFVVAAKRLLIGCFRAHVFRTQWELHHGACPTRCAGNEKDGCMRIKSQSGSANIFQTTCRLLAWWVHPPSAIGSW